MATTTKQLSFLIVEDEPALGRCFQRSLASSGISEVAHSVKEAMEMLELLDGVDAVLLDFNLPDGNGIELLDVIRERWPYTAALVMTAFFRKRIANAAAERNALFAFKPPSPALFRALVARAVAAVERRARCERQGADADDETHAAIAEHVARCQLSPREQDVLTLHVAGFDRLAASERLGISQHTVKSHVQSIVSKAKVATLQDLVRSILRESWPTPLPGSGQPERDG